LGVGIPRRNTHTVGVLDETNLGGGGGHACGVERGKEGGRQERRERGKEGGEVAFYKPTLSTQEKTEKIFF